MTTNFSEIDSAILKLIEEGVDTFGRIYQHESLLKAIEATYTDNTGPKIDAYRLADRRLQSMRKAGKIALVRPGPKWAIA